MIGKPVYARKDGTALGKCIGYAISSKGEPIYLIEGSETFLIGTALTISTVRVVDKKFTEQTVVVERAEGKHTVKRLSWSK